MKLIGPICFSGDDELYLEKYMTFNVNLASFFVQSLSD